MHGAANMVADCIAGDLAALHQAGEADDLRAQQADADARLIQSRRVAIAMHCAVNDPGRDLPRGSRPRRRPVLVPLRQLEASSGHRLEALPGGLRLRCNRCGRQCRPGTAHPSINGLDWGGPQSIMMRFFSQDVLQDILG